MKNIYLTLCFIFLIYNLIQAQPFTTKYIPPEEKALLIIGQDLGAIGGFDAPNNDGYYENLQIVPAGVTTYVGFDGNMAGLNAYANWGSGDVCAQWIVENPIYDSTVLAIGLYMVGDLVNIILGKHDHNIDTLGLFIARSKRPVFLRIGYEFDLQYSQYPSQYVAAYKYIVDRLRKMPVENFVSVWQSVGGKSYSNELLPWYPGDSYVDWVGYSHFEGHGKATIALAREKNKPVLICEATPTSTRLDLEDGEVVWNKWYQPMFDHIKKNKDVIKGLAYINVDWYRQPMWASSSYWGETRVQVNDTVKARWIREITKDFWLNKSDTLYQVLSFDPSTIITSINKRNNIFNHDEIIILQHNNFIIIRSELRMNSLKMFDISGQLQFCKRLKDQNTIYIPSSNLTSGIYFLNIETEASFIQRKVFIH